MIDLVESYKFILKAYIALVGIFFIQSMIFKIPIIVTSLDSVLENLFDFQLTGSIRSLAYQLPSTPVDRLISDWFNYSINIPGLVLFIIFLVLFSMVADLRDIRIVKNRSHNEGHQLEGLGVITDYLFLRVGIAVVVNLLAIYYFFRVVE